MELSPLSSFQLALHRWWWVTLLTFLGGLAGWGFHTLRPPLFEGVATFTVAIDFSQTGQITEREQDQSINAFQAIIQSPDVVHLVIADLEGRGIPANAADVRTPRPPTPVFVIGQTAFLERRQSLIELHVRNSDPQIAANLANLWSDYAYTVLVEAYGHALQAASLRQYLAGLNSCLQASQSAPDGSADETPAAEALCGQLTLDELKQRSQTAETDLQTEQLASRALLPALMFDLAIPAEIPSSPVSYVRTWLILAGAFIGLVLGSATATWRADVPSANAPSAK